MSCNKDGNPQNAYIATLFHHVSTDSLEPMKVTLESIESSYGKVNQCTMNRVTLQSAVLNKPKCLKHILKMGGDPNIRNEYGTPCFFYCTRPTHHKCASLLLECGCDPAQLDLEGCTAADAATYYNNQDMVKEFVTSKFFRFHRDNKGRTMLHWAAMCGHVDMFMLLLQSIPFYLTDWSGMNPFSTAVLYHNTSILFKVDGWSTHVKEDFRFKNAMTSSISAALINNNKIALTHLVRENYMDPHWRDSLTERTFYHYMGYCRNPNMIDRVRDCFKEVSQFCNLSPNSLDRDDNNALHMACYMRNKMAVEKLVTFGANCMQQNRWGYTPLHVAAIKNLTDIAKFLSTVCSDAIDVKDIFGNTPRTIRPKLYATKEEISKRPKQKYFFGAVRDEDFRMGYPDPTDTFPDHDMDILYVTMPGQPV